MQKKVILSIFLASAILIAGIFNLYRLKNINEVKAGANENVSGFAWSSNIGWISFNNTSGGGLNNYGVNITDNGAVGILSGYAWSNNAGWISFNSADLAGCPAAPCSAVVDKRTGQVSGWAKFLTSNDWLKLQGTNYGVLISKSTGDFFGHAWGGEIAGWISFNCNQPLTGDICPLANYKVTTSFDMNIKPTVALGSAPNPAPVNLCLTPAYSFSWIFNDLDAGDTQSQYQLQIDKDGTFDSFGAGEVDLTIPVVAQGGDIQFKEVLLARNPSLNQLGYNSTNYKWRMRVWDNWNEVSSWVNGNNFTSPLHVYPSPNFTWKPQTIIKDQLIQFCSIKQTGVCDVEVSTCYGASYPSCLGAAFAWAIPADAEFASSTNANTPNPVIKFKGSGNTAVSLQIQDNAGACSASKNVRVTLPLPKWQEILPK